MRRTLSCNRSSIFTPSRVYTRLCTPVYTRTCTINRRHGSSKATVSKALSESEVERLLQTPTWSVASLLPSKGTHLEEDARTGDIKKEEEITPKLLHHLLRLSALQPPSSPEEEAKMLKELRGQLHFVSNIQKVDTTGVEPLQAIRDESEEAQRQNTIGLDAMKEALAREEVVGTHHKRIRRRLGPLDEKKAKEAEDWDVLGQAPNKVGRFFVVESNEVER